MLLTIENFQSIQKVELEIPDNSFTCIVGQSNIGKSAIRRALEALLFNKSSASYIRNGSRTCTVRLVLGDLDITWSRDDKTVKYTINGETFSKLSKGVPDLILDKGFKELTLTNKEKVNIHIAPQFDNIFLLNKTGGSVTEIISNLGNVQRIINANKNCSQDINKLKERVKIRKEDLEDIDNRLLNFTGLDSQIFILENIKNDIEKILDRKNILSKLTKLNSDISISEEKIESLQKIKSYKEIEAPDSNTFITLKKKYDELQKIGQKIRRYKDIKEIKDICINKDYTILRKLQDTVKGYDRSERSVAVLKGIETLPNIFIENKDTSKLENIKEKYTILLNTKKRILTYKEQIPALDVERDKLVIEYSQLQKELGICPLCNNPFCQEESSCLK